MKLYNPFDPKKYPNCYEGHNYALDVVSGKIPNSIYILGACERYLKDLEEKKYPFKPEWAEKFLRLVQKFDHVIGTWETKNIKLEPWQKWVGMNVVGFQNPQTGYRRFRTAHLEVPRGNGKSALLSVSCLYFLSLDNPVGNIVSTFATKNEQARIVLDSARAMARTNKAFLKATKTEVLAHKIIHTPSNSFMRAMSSDAKSLDGGNDLLAVIDELHSVTRSLFDVVSSGMSKRADSLLFCITTAGFDMEGVGFSQSQYAKKVCLGETEDDSFFAAVYCADEGDDIYDEKTWKKANPNYGVSVDPITFEAKAKKAKETPADLPNFKVKHLNIWLSEARAFYNTQKWDLCADPNLSLESFVGQPCIVGLDVASKIDLTSLGIVFKKEDKFYVFDKSFIPEERVKEVRNSMYDNAIGRGELIATKGEAINYDVIFAEIMKLTKKFRVLDLNADPWNATEIMQRLEKERVNVLEFKMNVANLSEPTKRLDALIREGKLRHSGSSLLRWCLSSVVCQEDHNGNVYPRKAADKLKIDPIISILMALAGHLQKEQEVSVYESRGIRVI